MKTIKQLLLFSLCVVTAYESSAQVVHKNPDPDIEFQMPLETNNTMVLDIDGDQEDDIRFTYFNFPSFGIWNLGISQADSNQAKIEILADDDVAKSPIGDYYVKQLSENDEVSSDGIFTNDYPQVGDIYNANFNGQTDKYIGFRLKSGANEFIYGWMAVELTGSDDMTFTISEYAYQNMINTPIDAGQTMGVGIAHTSVKALGVEVFPNPTSNYVRIKGKNGTKIEQLKIFSLQGKLINEWLHPVLPIEVETMTWDQGVYLFEMIEEGNVYTEMLIKN